MKRTLVVGLMSTFFMACGDSTGILPADLSGTWTATELVATNPANTSQTQDLRAAGATFSITFNADGTFTQTVGDTDGTTNTDTGTFSVVGTTLTIAESGSGSPTPVTATRDGDTMTFTWSDNDVDWDGDGTDDDTNFRAVLTRS